MNFFEWLGIIAVGILFAILLLIAFAILFDWADEIIEKIKNRKGR